MQSVSKDPTSWNKFNTYSAVSTTNLRVGQENWATESLIVSRTNPHGERDQEEDSCDRNRHKKNTNKNKRSRVDYVHVNELMRIKMLWVGVMRCTGALREWYLMCRLLKSMEKFVKGGRVWWGCSSRLSMFKFEICQIKTLENFLRSEKPPRSPVNLPPPHFVCIPLHHTLCVPPPPNSDFFFCRTFDHLTCFESLCFWWPNNRRSSKFPLPTNYTKKQPKFHA
jgi:hypothetical protein